MRKDNYGIMAPKGSVSIERPTFAHWRNVRLSMGGFGSDSFDVTALSHGG